MPNYTLIEMAGMHTSFKRCRHHSSLATVMISLKVQFPVMKKVAKKIMKSAQVLQLPIILLLAIEFNLEEQFLGWSFSFKTKADLPPRSHFSLKTEFGLCAAPWDFVPRRM